MRTHTDKDGNVTHTLDKTESRILKRAAIITRELARYPENYPRAADASAALLNIDKPYPRPSVRTLVDELQSESAAPSAAQSATATSP